jgi:exonuclease SbcC
MILRELKLQNFRRFRDARIAFPEGIVGLVGPNGAGKSTIFEAIAWVLFGNSMLRTGKGFDLVPRGAACRAELRFECAGEEMTVIRRLTGGGQFSAAQLFQGGSLVAADGRSTRRVLRRWIGEARTFLRTIYCRQGETLGFLRELRTERRAAIASILGLDLLDRAMRLIRSDRAEIGAPIRTARTEEVAREMEGVLRERAKTVRQIEGIRQEIARSAERRDQVDRLRLEIEVLEREAASLGRFSQDLEARRQRVQSAGKVSTGSLERLQECRARIRDSQRAIADLDTQILALSSSAQARCPICGGPLERKAAIASRRSQRRSAAEELAALRRLENECARQWEREKERSRLELELQRAVELERANGAKLAPVNSRIASLRVELQGVDFDPARHEELQRRYRELESGLTETAVRETRLRARLDQSRRDDERRERAGELKELEDLIREFESRLLGGIRPVLGAQASEILEAVTKGRFPRLALDEFYRILLEDRGRMHVVQRFSGGEQDLAALALRVALSRVLAGGRTAQCLILDETFGAQDRERRRALVQALGRLIPPFRQIFVVTHAEEIQEMLPNVLLLDGDLPDGAHVREG